MLNDGFLPNGVWKNAEQGKKKELRYANNAIPDKEQWFRGQFGLIQFQTERKRFLSESPLMVILRNIEVIMST